MGNMGHAALADMLSLYIRKEVCETKRLQLAPIPKRSEANLAVWPLEEDMGKMPELALWSEVSSIWFSIFIIRFSRADVSVSSFHSGGNLNP